MADNLLSTILGVLTRTPLGEMTAGFVELYHAATAVLDPGDQATAQRALALKREENDAAHAELQQLLEQAKGQG